MTLAQESGVLADFQPAVRTWFEHRFRAPTDAQEAGWPSIRLGQNTLLAAPTGSGKTLAAFLSSRLELVFGRNAIRHFEFRGCEPLAEMLVLSALG